MSALDFYIIQEYLNRLVPPRSGEMEAMEAFAEEHGFPIIGPVTGYLCYQLARMIAARSVFELGSGYGYSTAWFARAVKENGGGTVHHVVWDEGLSQQAREHLTRLDLVDAVQFHVGEAVEALSNMPGQFDLIFNDIEKEAYPDSLPVIKSRLRPGGILIIDNMLWGGCIFDSQDNSASTNGILRATDILASDPDWIISLLPVRDGVIVAYKK
ncbi:MAG: O-methyltransferase [Chloroflexota bacterium]